MKILVLGAGIIGTTTAYYLARDGHEVTVVDRCAGAGRDTSFSNSGGLCPGFAGPWSGPTALRKLPGWLLGRDGAVRIRPRLDPRQWSWLLRFVANCRADRFVVNKRRMQRIAHYSIARLAEIRAETGIEFDYQAAGVLQLFRSEVELAGGRSASRILSDLGVAHRLVDADEALRIEPALGQSSVRFEGGLHLTEDGTGDCHLFTARLAERLGGAGVTFHFDTAIERVLVEQGRIVGIATKAGPLTADAYVVALGSHTPLLLRPLGIDLPIYPVKGYAFTLPIAKSDAAPRSAVLDEHTKIMVTRLGDRLRVGGIAEITGYDRAADGERCAFIRDGARALFPDAVDYGAADYWTGLRPMTPDGPPYLGATPIANLFLNAGQGSNGWTQAAGCGRIVADIVASRKPDIDLSGLTLMDRYAER